MQPEHNRSFWFVQQEIIHCNRILRDLIVLFSLVLGDTISAHSALHTDEQWFILYSYNFWKSAFFWKIVARLVIESIVVRALVKWILFGLSWIFSASFCNISIAKSSGWQSCVLCVSVVVDNINLIYCKYGFKKNVLYNMISTNVTGLMRRSIRCRLLLSPSHTQYILISHIMYLLIGSKLSGSLENVIKIDI